MTPAIRRLLLAFAATAATLTATTSAAAQPAVGVLNGNGNTLMTFDTDAPGTITALRPITGLQTGEKIEAIDFRDRPAPGEPPAAQGLYGLAIVPGASDSAHLYRIDLGSGSATPIGAPVNGLLASTAWDVDFDAATDRLRLVTDSDLNMRFDPDTGTVAGMDAAINPSSAVIDGIAYDESVPGRVTNLRGFELTSRELVTIGGDAGDLTIYGITDVTAPVNGRMGYDYSPYDPAAPDTQRGYVTLSTALGTGELYRVTPLLGVRALEPVGELAGSLRAFALLPVTAAQFSVAAFAAAEGDHAGITVTRSGPATSTASIGYATADGSAVAGVDYAATSGRLTFAPGETTKTFDVSLLSDDRTERDETLRLVLSDPSAPLGLGSQATSELTVHDATRGPTRLTLAGVPERMRLATLLRRGITVRIAPNAPVRALEVSLLGTTRRAQISRRGNLVLVSRAYAGPFDDTRTYVLRPKARLVGHPSHPVRLRVKVAATAADGREIFASRVVTVTVARRRH